MHDCMLGAETQHPNTPHVDNLCLQLMPHQAWQAGPGPQAAGCLCGKRSLLLPTQNQKSYLLHSHTGYSANTPFSRPATMPAATAIWQLMCKQPHFPPLSHQRWQRCPIMQQQQQQEEQPHWGGATSPRRCIQELQKPTEDRPH